MLSHKQKFLLFLLLLLLLILLLLLCTPPPPRDLNPSLEAQIPAFNPSDWDLGLKSGIWSSRLGFELQGRDLGLKAGIWALRLGSESEDGWMDDILPSRLCTSL